MINPIKGVKEEIFSYTYFAFMDENHMVSQYVLWNSLYIEGLPYSVIGDFDTQLLEYDKSSKQKANFLKVWSWIIQ